MSSRKTKRPDMRAYFRAQINVHVNGMFAPGRFPYPQGVVRVNGTVTDRIITVTMQDGTVWRWRGGSYAERKVNGCYAPLMPKATPDAPSGDPRFAHLDDPAERAWLTNVKPSDVLSNAHRIYDFMRENGIPADSYTRELAFKKAAEDLGISYDVLYNAWLAERPVQETTAV